MAHEPNLAVLDNQVKNLENVVDELVRLQRDQSAVNSNLEKAIELLQQSHNEFVNQQRIHVEPKVKVLWENRSQVKGGWVVVSTLAGMIVGGCAVGGFIYELLINHKP